MREIKKEDFEYLQKKNAEKKLTVSEISTELSISARYAEVYRTLLDNQDVMNEIFTDEELQESNSKLVKQVQLFRDTNRIERSTVRNHARMHNALEALNIIESSSSPILL